MYWDISKPLSYNCLFNFIVGNRGGGKTYGAKQWAIKDFIKTGAQFVYVRRYKQELKNIKKFFDDIAKEFPDHTFAVNGRTFIIDNEEAGYALPLSTSKIEKSTPFPKVNKIIFDEFILSNGVYRYLSDEVVNFLELYSTIARDRDVRVFFLSNALTTTNPYFIYFNVQQPYGANIKAKDDILIEMVNDKELIEKKKQTRFGKIIAGTNYEKYSIENEFFLDNRNFVEKKPNTAKYTFGMAYKGKLYGVWVDYKAGKYYVSLDTDPSVDLVYSITLEDHTPNTLLLKGRKSVLVEGFIRSYKYGLVRFESIDIKNVCADIIKLTI